MTVRNNNLIQHSTWIVSKQFLIFLILAQMGHGLLASKSYLNGPLVSIIWLIHLLFRIALDYNFIHLSTFTNVSQEEAGDWCGVVNPICSYVCILWHRFVNRPFIYCLYYLFLGYGVSIRFHSFCSKRLDVTV